MKRHSALLPLLAVLATPLFAQTPAPLPTAPSSSLPVPSPQSTPPAQPAAPAASAPSAAQARANTILLSVIVTDKNHNPVHDLKLSDFQLREGSAPQTIKTVEEHTPANAKPATPFPAMEAGIFTNYEPTPTDNGPLNILLVDRLNTPLAGQSILNDQLIAFLKTIKPGTHVAVVGLNSHLIYLQGFTSDPRTLLSALETSAPSGSSSLAANVQQFEAPRESLQTQLRIHSTLEAVNSLARYLAGLPGRKNLIWFSGSFPLSVVPDGEQPNPFAAATDLQDEYRDTANLLIRSQVVLYPVDLRGLSATSANTLKERPAASPAAVAKDQTDFVPNSSGDQATMRQMANDTGGQVFAGVSSLADAVNKAVAAGSSYYTLSYVPANTDYDGSFRKIELSTDRPGLQLTSRRGYFADIPGTKSAQQRKQLTSSPLAPDPQRQSIRTAMQRGTPAATQILLKTLVNPAGDPTDDDLAPNNAAPPTTKGPFRKYNINYAAAPQDITLKVISPGHYEVVLEFVAFLYDQNAAVVNSIGQTIHAKMTAEDVRSVFKTGLQYHQVISVPADGNYLLRVAVRDITGDHIGTVEVRIDSVKNLAVVAPPPPRRAAPTLSDLPK